MPTASPEEPSPPVKPGDLIAGKYRVEEILGSGGMAFVVAARHEDLGQLVAIKLLRPDLPDHDVAAARFLREARASARIQSDYVARVFDVGVTESGHPYFVMEHFQGADLDETLISRGPLPVSDAVDYVLEALEAVAHAHALGIVHRDLKPANMFLASRPDGTPRIKVLDFGISKTNELTMISVPQMVTSPNALLGSPAYMSPEQARSSTTVDLRTDIWSLGVILYELLSRRHPFEGETAPRMLAAIASEAPIPLRSVRPHIPAALERVILRCMERDLDARYQNAGELARALAPFGSERTKGLPGRISLLLGAPPPPAASSPGASLPQHFIDDDATADTLRSDDVASGQVPPARVEETAAARTAPDPGTPSLQGSARDAARDAARGASSEPGRGAASQGPAPKSAAKGRMITLGLIAVTMLAVGIIATAAWQASGRLLEGGAQSGKTSPSAQPKANVGSQSAGPQSAGTQNVGPQSAGTQSAQPILSASPASVAPPLPESAPKPSASARSTAPSGPTAQPAASTKAQAHPTKPSATPSHH